MGLMDDYEGPVSGDDLIREIVSLYPETVDYLAECGMHCIGCASSQFETLYEACRVHHLRAAYVIRDLNRIITE